MTPLVVADASAVIALLLDAGDDGQWAARTFAGTRLLGPDLLPFECSNIIRRQELAGRVSADQAAQSHADLLDLTIELWPYAVLSTRVWALRANLSCDDASYVALAEQVGAPLVTLDRRMSRAPGLRCAVLTP